MFEWYPRRNRCRQGEEAGVGAHERTPAHPSPWKNPEQVERPGRSPCKRPNCTRAAGHKQVRRPGPGPGFQHQRGRGAASHARTGCAARELFLVFGSQTPPQAAGPGPRGELGHFALEDRAYRFVLITHRSQSQPDAHLSPQ